MPRWLVLNVAIALSSEPRRMALIWPMALSSTVRAIAETGVDVISVGALTHSARAVDVADRVAEVEDRQTHHGRGQPAVTLHEHGHERGGKRAARGAPDSCEHGHEDRAGQCGPERVGEQAQHAAADADLDASLGIEHAFEHGEALLHIVDVERRHARQAQNRHQQQERADRHVVPGVPQPLLQFVHHALVDYVVRLVFATRQPKEHGMADNVAHILVTKYRLRHSRKG